MVEIVYRSNVLEQARIRCPRDLQPFVRGQRDLSVRAPITDARDRVGQLLIGEVDRAWLLPPADHAGESTRSAVSGASQGHYLGLQRLPDGVQPQRNHGLDQPHRAVDLLAIVTTVSVDAFLIRLPCRSIRTTLFMKRLLSFGVG